MHLSLRVALAALALAAPVTAAAQTALPTVLNGNQIKTASATVIFDPTGAPLGTTANPIKTTCISGCSGGSGGAVTISGSLPGFGSTPTIYDPSTASLAASIAAPINAQTTHGVNIGGIEGITAAGTAGSYPVTIQGNASGVAVPVSVNGIVQVQPATNSNGATTQVQSDTNVAINVSTAGTTQLIALAAGKAIYITGWDIVVAAADNVTLEYGTGTNCATGTTALTGAYNFAANGGLAVGSGLGMLMKIPSGNALCIVTSAATQASGRVSYAQF